MGSRKSQAKKEVISKKLKQNRRIPIFVIAKTNRKVTQNSERRNWRTKKLNIDVD
ncbi:50S ribosomal protein L39e [Candidatus Gugararchaeum adminiculabundum]|nr:50S ribosomal protein L39e [Candidatus Gugararchaeum adminiculabundum]